MGGLGGWKRMGGNDIVISKNRKRIFTKGTKEKWYFRYIPP